MRFLQHLSLSAVCLLTCVTAVEAQFLVTYQGPTGSDGTLEVYNTTIGQPIQIGSFSSTQIFPTNAVEFLSTSTGDEHFIISKIPPPTLFPNTTAAVTVLGVNYIQRKGGFGVYQVPVNTAVLTPDDTKLVLGENLLHIFDVSNINGPYPELTGTGLAIPNVVTVADVAIDYDSQIAYVLGTGVTQSFLSTVSLSSFTIGQTITVPTGATTVTIGPTGLLYVTSPNTITEIDPASLLTTTNGTITVTLNPGKPVFTPAIPPVMEQYLVSADPAPVAGGSGAVLVDLTTHAQAGSVPSVLNSSAAATPITALYPISDTTIDAYVAGNTTLYSLLIGSNGGMILTPPSFAGSLTAAGSSTTNVEAFTTAPGFGAAGRNAPQYVFVADSSTNIAYEIDPVSSAVVTQFPLQNFPGAMTYFVPTNPGGTPTTVLTYGNNQTIIPGTASLPLVIRVLDQNGIPVGGLSVSFKLNPIPNTDPTAPIVYPAMLNPQLVPGYTGINTGSDGYAEVTLISGTTAPDLGAIPVSVTAGNVSTSFTVNVGATSATAAALSIVSGQGQVVYQNANPNPAINPDTNLPFVPLFASTPNPLVVKATDASGNPVPNAAVTFTIVPNSPGGTPVTTMVTTDSTGQATATFPSSELFPSGFIPAFAQSTTNFATETIAATTGTLTADFYLTTILSALVTAQSCTTPPPCLTNVPQFNLKLIKPAYASTITGAANSTLPSAVQVVVTTIPNNISVPNVGITVNTGTSTTVTNAMCSEPTGSGVILTDSTGTATCDLHLNGIAGSLPLFVTATQQQAGVVGFGTLTITPNPTATISIVSGNNQLINESTNTSPFTIQVLDSSNNPIPFTPVTWQITSGSGTLTSVSTTTDINGMASATGVIATTPGQATVTATVGTVTATFAFTIGAAAGNIVVSSGDNQQAQQSATFSAPLVVQVLDIDGNPAPFAGVTFSVATANSGVTFVSTPTGATSVTETTDANGMASVQVIAGTAPEPITIAVTSTGATASSFFTLTVLSLSPSSVQVFNAASFTSGISPGSLISLTGINLTPTIQNVVSDPTTLQNSGYSASINGVTAPILALVNENGAQQINLQVPFEVTPGATTIMVQTPQGTDTVNATVSALSPGIFTNGTVTVNGSSFPQAVALRSDGSYISATNPAHEGEMITFFATGLGQTTPTAVTGSVGVPEQLVFSPLYVAINHLSTTVSSAVYETGSVGVYAITTQVPAETTTGPGQPLSLFMLDSTGAGYNAPDVYIPITP